MNQYTDNSLKTVIKGNTFSRMELILSGIAWQMRLPQQKQSMCSIIDTTNSKNENEARKSIQERRITFFVNKNII